MFLSKHNITGTTIINYSTNKSKVVELPEVYKVTGYRLSGAGYSLKNPALPGKGM